MTTSDDRGIETHHDTETDHGAEVSFAEVAAEDAEESVAREAEATPVGRGDAEEPTGSLEPNTAPEQPTISSLLGPGPVSGGDDAAI